jgi:hypothetical protein
MGLWRTKFLWPTSSVFTCGVVEVVVVVVVAAVPVSSVMVLVAAVCVCVCVWNSEVKK